MTPFESLLARGYLPVQLPPGFSSVSFANAAAVIAEKWPKKGPITSSERYSVARSSFYRRQTSILNPAGFYYLAKEVGEYWPQIESHYKKSKLSKSVPTLDGSLRAINLRKFSELHEEKILHASGFRFALVTDITGFFPTIYTHTIPWALHTKAVAKVEQGAVPKYFGNILDRQCMAVQDRQTVGLPIGPDTSHIIAEIVAVAIDERIKEELGRWPNGFRYVDDYFLFFNEREDAERALAAITRAVVGFELQLNAAKTRIVEVRELVDESWKYRLKRLKLRPQRREQRTDIHHFFESLFALERRFRDESLVKYGLKRLSSTIVKKSNWPVFEAYLLKCGYGFPNTIQVIAHILATYRKYEYPLGLKAISRFCNNCLAASAAADHHGEVSWLLWICKELEIPVLSAAGKEVARMGSPVCTLILLDLQNEGLAKKAIEIDTLKSFAAPNALMGSDWMLAYEAGRREWLGVDNDDFISAHEYFGPLNDASVALYNEENRLPPIFTLTAPPWQPVDFDADWPIDDSFEFDEMDEEYFDSGSEGDGDSDDEGEDADVEEDGNSDF
ncbi:MAG TPA: RNA-directed DNA polymerase [Steroidobacteraceae bacterium]|jgi:hypothetical protein